MNNEPCAYCPKCGTCLDPGYNVGDLCLECFEVEEGMKDQPHILPMPVELVERAKEIQRRLASWLSSDSTEFSEPSADAFHFIQDILAWAQEQK